MADPPRDPARDRYIEYLARCEQAFHPFAPIDLPEFFAGRVQQIKRLDAEISAPGRHVAIFGERGVGKTSLAQLAYFFLRRNEEDMYFVSCQKTTTFDALFSEVLKGAGVELVLNGVESEGERHGSLGVGPAQLGGKRRMRQRFRTLTTERRIQPRLLLDQFGEREGLIVIDEYDRVEDTQTHTRVAELIKHFSDARSKTKIILVGVAETLTQLIGEHESLSRSLGQIKLDRMSDDELREIINRGENQLDTSVKNQIKHRIVRLADGFPYFVHLLCRHAARLAANVLLEAEDAKPVVADDEYSQGLRGALENAEHSLVDQYQKAVVTTRRESEKFELVLSALALSSDREVQVGSIASYAELLTGKHYANSAFNYHLGELVKPDRGSILVRIREGFYGFMNPLMRPYIRFRLELENVLGPGKQFIFPFMRGTGTS